MKLGLHGWKMGKALDLDEILTICRESGLDTFEIMVHPDFRSSVSLETSAAERAAIRKKFEDAGIGIAALAITCRYDWLDAAKVEQEVEESKRYVDLAKDIGAPRLRCLGDQLHEDEEPKEKTIARVAGALRAVSEYGDGAGIDCPVEMHGQFSNWQNALALVKQVDHPRCYLVHNGTARNAEPGDWNDVWAQLEPYIKHVHVHDILDDKFPHKRFFQTLRDSGYNGIVSLELEPSADPVRVLKLTKALIGEWVAQG